MYASVGNVSVAPYKHEKAQCCDAAQNVLDARKFAIYLVGHL